MKTTAANDVETYYGFVDTSEDAFILFEACRVGLLPRLRRRLTKKDRELIRPGSVFVWDEQEADMKRWTDGKRWSTGCRTRSGFWVYWGIQHTLLRKLFTITLGGRRFHLITYHAGTMAALNLTRPGSDSELCSIIPHAVLYNNNLYMQPIPCAPGSRVPAFMEEPKLLPETTNPGYLLPPLQGCRPSLTTLPDYSQAVSTVSATPTNRGANALDGHGALPSIASIAETPHTTPYPRSWSFSTSSPRTSYTKRAVVSGWYPSSSAALRHPSPSGRQSSGGITGNFNTGEFGGSKHLQSMAYTQNQHRGFRTARGRVRHALLRRHSV